MDTDNLVTLYYDQYADLLAIYDSDNNRLLDLGIATEVKYAEFFAYKSSNTRPISDICFLPNQKLFTELDLDITNPENSKTG